MPFRWLLHLPAEAMTAFATAVGFALIGNLSAEEQNALGNMLFLIGQILSSNGTQAQADEPTPSVEDIDSLSARIAALEARLGGGNQ